jgi:hypothetical protein
LEVLPKRKTVFPKAGTFFTEQILAKFAYTQQLRKELQNVKKLARERAKAITLRIPQFEDCKNHFDKKKEKGSPRGICSSRMQDHFWRIIPRGKGTMAFICEGQSAAGSITSCRK